MILVVGSTLAILYFMGAWPFNGTDDIAAMRTPTHFTDQSPSNNTHPAPPDTKAPWTVVNARVDSMGEPLITSSVWGETETETDDAPLDWADRYLTKAGGVLADKANYVQQRLKSAQVKIVAGTLMALPLTYPLQRKYKIVLSFYQVIQIIPQFYPAQFDPRIMTLASHLRIVNLSENIAPFACFGNPTYYQIYAAKVALPAIITLIFIWVGLWSPDLRMKLMEVYLLFQFTIYTSIAATAGESFRCANLSPVEGGRDHQYLMADYRVNCNTAFHQKFEMFDVAMIVVYPIGIPFFWMCLLWPHRHELASRGDTDALRRIRNENDGYLQLPSHMAHVGWVCLDYKSEFWWWECAECMRKWLVVSGSIWFFDEWPSSQILCAILVSILYLNLFVWSAPYIDTSDDVLAYVAHWTLLMVFILAAYTRFRNVSRWEYKMHEVYAWDSLILIAWGLISFVLILSVLMAIWEVRQEVATHLRLDSAPDYETLQSLRNSMTATTHQDNLSSRRQTKEDNKMELTRRSEEAPAVDTRVVFESIGSMTHEYAEPRHGAYANRRISESKENNERRQSRPTPASADPAEDVNSTVPQFEIIPTTRENRKVSIQDTKEPPNDTPPQPQSSTRRESVC